MAVLLLAFANVSAQTTGGLIPFSAVYELDSPGATLTTRVTNKNDTILYQNEITSSNILGKIIAGKITTNSSARRDDNGVLFPLQYDYIVERLSGKSRRYLFDWEKKQATTECKDKEHMIELPDDVLDENVVLLRLAEDVAALGTRFDKTYRILSCRKIKERHFTAVSKQLLATALGELETIKVERYKKRETDRVFWLSSAHHFLPVKIDKLKYGKIEQVISIMEVDMQHVAR